MKHPTPARRSLLDDPQQWTHGQLSALFWHHHNRFFVASGLALLTGLAGVVMQAIGQYLIGLALVPATLILTAVSAWHRARTSLLTQLRFPPRDGGE